MVGSSGGGGEGSKHPVGEVVKLSGNMPSRVTAPAVPAPIAPFPSFPPPASLADHATEPKARRR